MNFWNLQFNNLSIDWWGVPKTFDINKQMEIYNIINRFTSENKKLVEPYMNIVKDSIAPKYDSIVPI